MTRRIVRATLSLAAILASCAALAGPAEDFAAGSAAYRQGDVRGAMASLRKAADAGHARAQVLLGSILDAAEQDAEAARYLAMASAQGDPEGSYLLAALYATGEGVPQDLAKARALLERSAATGHRESIVAIALAFARGGLGVTEAERASPAAAAWLRKAGDAGHVPSLERLASAHRNGELGLPRDVKAAEELEARVRAIRGTPERTPARRRAPAPRPPAAG